ncbi:MAG: hypothetical protein J6X60_10460, partial [Ruminiclostridium sp.]|nr:hypothetical protein [Ruminiclostridium sp.]
MSRQLNIAGINSNEIYTIYYPNNLMNFCRYDFSLFLEHCTDLCRLAARTGEYNVDDVYAIRNSISGCHKYYEQNMRTIFEKIVVDCWIDYLCKQSEVSVNSLWQSFLKCRNPFEKAIFGRLSDYRYNRAINEWTNLLKMQEYARTKTDFVFGVKLKSPQQALSRANYFDLLFNVAANEEGFPINEIASVGVFSAGRLPNSPFVMNSAAKEIARNQLKNIEYKDGYRSRKNPDLTDKIAMDAFSAMKNFIPDKDDSMAKTIIKSLTSAPQMVYVPRSFKAVVDLEIDASAQSGAYLQKCARCGDYYIRDEEYDFDYCSRIQREGGTCLDLMKIDDPELAEATSVIPEHTDTTEDNDDDPKIIYIDKDTVNEKMDSLYKEMAARVNVDLTQRDFSLWYQRELRLRDEILLGNAGEKQLDDFIRLSRSDHFSSRKQMAVFEKKDEKVSGEEIEMTENGKQIKKFVFEKVDRESITPRPLQSSLAESEKAAMEAVQRLFAAERKDTTEPRTQTAAPIGYPAQNYPQNTSPAYGYQTFNGQSFLQNSMIPSQYPGVSNPNAQPYYQPQGLRGRQVSRVIKGNSANTQDYSSRSGSVVIPNGNDERPSFISQYGTPSEADMPKPENAQGLQRETRETGLYSDDISGQYDE